MTRLIRFNYKRILRYIQYAIGALFVFKNPLTVLKHYMMNTAPVDKKVFLRNGLCIMLSEHPDDLATVFVVFVKKDYGVVLNKSIVVDIGANIGVFALYAAVSGAEKVYAIEPNKRAYDVLIQNIKLNNMGGSIFPHQLAITDRDNEMVTIEKGSSPHNKISRGGASRGDYEEVPAASLHYFVQMQNIDKIDILKCDCEGSEYNIFLSAVRVPIERVSEIRMEFHDGPFNELIAYFKKHNFKESYYDKNNAMVWFSR